MVDSADVLADPEGVLSQLCVALRIKWDAAMLEWERGGRETDGIWASHWYGQVLQSTGFAAQPEDALTLDAAQDMVRDACQPHYDYLRRFAL